MSLQRKIEEIIAKDKLIHFCIGLLLAQLAYLSLWLVVLPIVVGLAKELFDKFVRKKGFNWLDLLATILGVAPVLILLMIKQCLNSV